MAMAELRPPRVDAVATGGAMKAALDFQGIEVDGRNVRIITDAFRLFPDAGLKPLVKHGIGRTSADGKVVVEASGWHPLGAWLTALEEILRSVGSSKMFEIGKQIPRVAVFPPEIRDAQGALQSLDVAYHMNFRKNGVPMLNPITGAIADGIGHYRGTVKSPRSAVVECDNPFPCDFDRGIVVALAQRFEPNAMIQHLDEARCRKRGNPICRYSVTW
jgi:hypothetical protein